MNKKPENDFAKYLAYFLSRYLPGQQNVSPNTLSSYRDAFKLFLIFWDDEKGYRAELIRICTVTKESVIEFLDWLEEKRKCSIATRNQRLAAIHAFFRYVQRESPENIFEIQKILSIPVKKKPKPVIPYLTADEMEILLQQPNRSSESGKRDLVLLVVLYDTAARVQELINLTYSDLRMDKPAVIRLYGKGRKTRHVPILGNTRGLLEEYLKSRSSSKGVAPTDIPIFCNQQNRKLTRRGVSYIINKYVEMARQVPEFHNNGIITPHVFRHSKSMHMLQAGINLIYIRDFLGHSSITSTEIYSRADSAMKRKALESAYQELDMGESPTWEKDVDLMNWLQNLCK
jgi:integrase/recombinase XerD